ncbi:hypothetical protein QCA50_015223 [Cerrena zonata]|uniref:Cytochrome P450 n=1 Tax=Cerrena zonata TaxID=2478898 RepID=A0AAW0FS43_9APHY
MKRMTPIFYRVVHTLRDAMKNKIEEGADEIDVLAWMHRCSLELIGQGGLGYSFDPLIEERPNEYAVALKEFVPAFFSLSFARLIWYRFQPLLNLVPVSWQRWVVDHTPSRRVQRMKNISDTIAHHATVVFNMKKDALRAGEEIVIKQVGEGKDLLSVLLRANTEATTGERIPDAEFISQMSFLILAATDTTSSSLTQIIELLGFHPEVQEKLRAEIMQACQECDGDIPYDTLVSLPYMDAICRETLRLYPPFSTMIRETRRDIIMPLSQPLQGVDGKHISEIAVPKDTTVFIAIRACNHNMQLWGEDVKEWKPDRWLAPLPKTLEEAHLPGVYSNQMTFLGGGRSCLGFKFSQLETKVVLNILLQSFRFSPSKKSSEVVWNLAAVRYPTIGKHSSKQELPLKVEMLQGTPDNGDSEL